MKKKFSQGYQKVGEAEVLESLMSLDLAVDKELALTVSKPFSTSTHTHTHTVCIGLRSLKACLGVIKPLLS